MVVRLPLFTVLILNHRSCPAQSIQHCKQTLTDLDCVNECQLSALRKWVLVAAAAASRLNAGLVLDSHLILYRLFAVEIHFDC